MQKRQVTRERREVERPIECGISAAHDQDALVAERVHLPDGVEHRAVLIGLDPGNRRTLGLERAAAGGNHDDFDLEDFSAIGGDPKQRITDLLDRLHHFLKMEGCPERLDLRHQSVAEPLAGDVRNAGNVVDRLFRIKLRALAADLVQNIDHVRLHVEQPKLEHGEQAARSGADDQYVGLDQFTHALRPQIRILMCG